MKPASYRLQEGCETCPHVCKLADYDCEDEFYCTFDALPRPLDPDMEYGELAEQIGYPTVRPDAWSKAHKAWNTWAEGREVSPRGICEHHPALKGKQ